MLRKVRLILLISGLVWIIMGSLFINLRNVFGGEGGDKIKLPDPSPKGVVSVEEALQKRRSVREYGKAPLTLAEISQLLWVAQGITHPEGLRTAPSAGALYPLEIYIAVGNVETLPPGVYKYQPRGHELLKIADGDLLLPLCSAVLDQECVRDAAVVFVIAAVYERTMKKYGERGIRYAEIEVGCAAENVHLQAVSLNLGTVFVGAFYDDRVRKVLKMKDDERPLAVIPIGRIK